MCFTFDKDTGAICPDTCRGGNEGGRSLTLGADSSNKRLRSASDDTSAMVHSIIPPDTNSGSFSRFLSANSWASQTNK